jgi:hypothetical protein
VAGVWKVGQVNASAFFSLCGRMVKLEHPRRFDSLYPIGPTVESRTEHNDLGNACAKLGGQSIVDEASAPDYPAPQAREEPVERRKKAVPGEWHSGKQ